MDREWGVGGRNAGMLGWAGMATMAGGVVLTVVRVAGIDSQAAEDFVVPVVLLLFMAFIVLAVRINIRRDGDSAPADDEEKGSGASGLVLQFLAAATAVGFAWWAFPTRFVSSSVSESGLYLTETFGVWGGIGAVVLGIVLLVFAPITATGGGWKALLGGLVAGATALLMVTALTPVLTTWVEIEHRVAAASEPAPIPTDVTRVGWTWEPEESVHEMRRGLRGPVVQYGDGFVGLDGATGEELWTYRRSHSEILGSGFVPGDEAHVYLLYREGRATPITILVLDTATGEVVRERPLAEHEDADSRRHVNADRMMEVKEDDGGGSVVGYDLDSAEPEWEYPLTQETGRVCLPGESVRTQLYGDRLLVSRTCLDEEHLDEGDLESGDTGLMLALDRVGRPEDAKRTLAVLDTTTGDELWRAEVEPSRRLAWDDASIVRPRSWSDGDPVVAAGESLFGLNTGEPVDVVPDHPEQEYYPYEMAPGTLAADTEGAVVAQEEPEALDPRLLKRSDSDGEVVSSFEVEWAIGRYLDGPTAVLEGALVSAVDAPRTSEAEDAGIEEGERAVLAIPLEDTDTERAGTPRWIRFDGERLFDPDNRHGRNSQSLVAVPGAVVSYVAAGYQDDGLPPVHGLVP